MYKRERPTIPQRRKSPSFSSSLLDAIYRSIDDDGDGNDLSSQHNNNESRKFYTNAGPPPIIKKHSTAATDKHGPGRAVLIEEWMEKQGSLCLNNSSASISSSSESTSSDADYFRRFSKPMPGQLRTLRKETRKKKDVHHGRGSDDDEGVGLGGFTKTKLRALKIYSELKNLKQPISPGGKISSFLNSIFNSGNVKKAKMCYVGAVDDVNFDRKSMPKPKSTRTSSSVIKPQTPSSCISTASSSFAERRRNKASAGMARSVRFHPVSMIMGEAEKPDEDPALVSAMPGNGRSSWRRVQLQDAIKKGSTTTSAGDRARGGCRVRLEDEDEDAESCASSELFELDHLIGIGRYREELPVYETTCLKINRAIANGSFNL